MGRHIRRLLRPRFLYKMLRTKAPGLYGWDVISKGIFSPGPQIGKMAATQIQLTIQSGHELGLHAWDHYRWQMHIDNISRQELRGWLRQGVDLLTKITGTPPVCSAAPGWKCNNLVLEEKLCFPFTYNSDCRGTTIFYPTIQGKKLPQPQIPVTLPTYDELIGRAGVTDTSYNEYIFSQLKPDGLNVLTIHAEVEGISRMYLFEEFMQQAKAKKVSIVPLGTLLNSLPPVAQATIVPREIPGREGWCACQAEDVP
jgi:undecaprenyl phosphate-alpha-L-ara4FN deformylase